MSVEDSGADVCVYTSSTSFNKEVKRKQAGVLQVLDAKKIRYKNYDISVDEQAKQRLKDLLSSQPTSAATDLPQIFNRENYCGNYDDFFWAVEEATVDKFLFPQPSPVPAAPDSEESEHLIQQASAGVTEASGAASAPLSSAENPGKNLTGNGSSVEDEIGVYTSSTSFSKEVKRKQAGVLQVLDAKKIRYKNYDISVDDQAKQRLKDLLSSQPTSATTDLPQIFNRENYCGNYDDFFWAVEDGLIQKFLHPPEAQKTENSSSATQAHTIEEVGSFMVQPSANMGAFKPIDVAAELAELASQSDEPMTTLAMRKEMLVLAEKSNVNFRKVEEINQTVENEPEEPIVSLSMRKEMLGFANKTIAQVNSGFQQSVSLSKTSVVAENNTKTETKTVLSKTDTSKTVTGDICSSEASVTSDHSVSSYETNSAESRSSTKSFLKSSELKIESSRNIAERKMLNMEGNTNAGNNWIGNTTSKEMSQTIQESCQSQSSLGLPGDFKASHNSFQNITSSTIPSTSVLNTTSSSKIFPSSSITSSYTMSSSSLTSSSISTTSSRISSSSTVTSSQFTTSSKTSIPSALSSTTSALPLMTFTTVTSSSVSLQSIMPASNHSATMDFRNRTLPSNTPSLVTGNACGTKPETFKSTNMSETFQTANLSSTYTLQDTSTMKSCSKISSSTKMETISRGQTADTLLPVLSEASSCLSLPDTKDQNTDMSIKADQKITRAQWEELKTLAVETGMDEEELFKLVGQYVDENNVKTVAKESSAIQEAERIMFGGAKTTESTKTFSSKTIGLGNKQPKGLSVKIEKGDKAGKNPVDPLVYENIAPDIDWNALMSVESPELLQDLLKDIIMIDSEDEEATKARLGILNTNSKEIPVLTEANVASPTAGGRSLNKSPSTTKDKSPTRSPNIKMGLTSLSAKVSVTDGNQISKTSLDTSATRKLTGVLTNAPGMSTRASTAYETSISTTSMLTSSCGFNISTQNAARSTGIHSPTLTIMSSGNIVPEKNERFAKTRPNLSSQNTASPQIITTCEGISLHHITASSSATSHTIPTKINTSSDFGGKSVSTTFRIPESQSPPMYSQNVAQTTKFSVSSQYGTGRFAENQPEISQNVSGLSNVPTVDFDKTISVTTSSYTTLMQTPSTVKMSSQPNIQMPPDVIIKKPQESKFPLQSNVKTTLQPSSNVAVVTRNQTFSYGAVTSSAGMYNSLKPDEEIGLHVSSKDTKPYGAANLSKDQNVTTPNKTDSIESSPVLTSGAITQNQTSIPQKSDKIGRAATFSDRNKPGIRTGLFGAMESVGKISTAPLLAVDTGHLQPASPRLPGLAGFVSSKMKSRPISPHSDKSLISALVSVGKAAVVPVAVVEPGAKKPSSSTSASGEKPGRESHDFRTMGASNLSQASSSEAGSGSGSSFVSRTTLIRTTGVATTKPSDVTTNTTLPQYQTNKYQSDISESQARYQLRNDEFKSSYQSGISKIPSRNISSISTTSVQFKCDRTPGLTLAGSSEYQASNSSNFSSYSGSTDSTSAALNNKTSGGLNRPAVTLTPSATLGSVRAGSSAIGSSHATMDDRIDKRMPADKSASKTSYDYHYKY